ncbi:MAG: dTDP-4-dehydrorhamnose 3,5-epimerase [Xanthobacteraceae bacterium]
MDVTTASIPGVLLIEPRYIHDARGYFVETFNVRKARDLGLPTEFVQDNHALSHKHGTVRALHFQIAPRAQAKLVRVARGSIYDVAVDLRAGSPAYGRWAAMTLTAQGGQQIFIPRGLAHGYCTLQDDTEVAYKVDDYYAPECEQGIAWNDPALAIDWPIPAAEAVLSDKDRALPRFADFVSPFRYDGD